VRRLAPILIAVLVTACTPVPRHTGPTVETALDLMFHNRYAAAAAQFQQLIRDHLGTPSRTPATPCS